ncbi:DNA topoisomerase I [Candidatus Bathyarchaeota archaeon A05DMB-2]|jgi:DNA topoisomerase-1|nr:DNA topoisomerase I [Candidatus Bathyarchaeota archaeon A05DMB-2]
MENRGRQHLQKYTLIITEKPDAAKRIAFALDSSGKAEKKAKNGVPYYSAKRQSEDIIVVPALGHLYTVTGAKKGRTEYPVFDFKWVPRHLAERGATRIRTWLKVISELAENADVFIDGCDYDVEGSIIGYCILKYACAGKEKIAKRMRYSTLTPEELEESYMQTLPHLDFALIEAGLTRHEVDWLYGINLSRALTNAAKNHSGYYATLSTGRVQGPTLKFLETREQRIRCFVPTQYWNIKAKVSADGAVFDVEYEKSPMETRAEADALVDNCRGKEGTVETIATQEFLQKPPFPFDLGSLQSEAYRFFRFTPMQTLNIAQRLYLDALISYPRTSSQKLAPTIGYETILKKLSRNTEYQRHAAELLAKPALKPNEGKMDDPAHPAVYPTGNTPERSLNSVEKKILDLIVRRFMAVFGDPATVQSVKVTISIGGNRFLLDGKQTLEEGWLRFYKPYIRDEDKPLPPLVEGQRLEVRKVEAEEKWTQPPARYNPGSLLRKMEKEGIGTKATRAGIIQTLYDRKYIRGEKIEVTDLGLEVVEAMKKYCPSVISSELTRKLEERMDAIQQGNETRENTLKDTIEILKPVVLKLKENERTIGASLSQAIKKFRLEERTVGVCPNCQNGKLVILRSKKTGKRFLGCTNYFEGVCKTAFPLPQRGTVKPSGKTCRGCGWPTVRVWLRGRRFWNLCFNPECPLKKESKRSVELPGLQQTKQL